MKKKIKIRKTLAIIATTLVLMNLFALILARDYVMPDISGTNVETIWSLVTFISIFGMLMYFIFKSFENH